MNFEKWFDTFIEEKGISTFICFEVSGNSGTNFIPFEAFREVLFSAPKREQEAIKTNLVKIDFVNGDVLGYIEHLCRAIAK